jgi:hypothetical protein
VIRQNSRRQCAKEFGTFLKNGSPEEIRLLYTVLNWHASKGSYHNELSIATAFQDQIDGSVEIFKLPSEYLAEVDAYIDALKKKPSDDAEDA